MSPRGSFTTHSAPFPAQLHALSTVTVARIGKSVNLHGLTSLLPKAHPALRQHDTGVERWVVRLEHARELAALADEAADD